MVNHFNIKQDINILMKNNFYNILKTKKILQLMFLKKFQ